MTVKEPRWDELCPHCEAKIDVHEHFVARDYQDEFVFDCPSCKKSILAEVEQVPEFGLSRND